MKILRNPIVVGLLGVVALALVFWNVVWPLLPHGRRPAAAALPLTTPITAALGATEKAKTLAAKLNSRSVATNGVATAATRVDPAALREESRRWMDAPRRDPFLSRQPPGSATNSDYPPARELLTVAGIWRQTSGSLATINHLVVGEGDTLLRFTIEQINSDNVSVRGPNGLETVGFKGAEPTPANDAPKVSPAIGPEAPEPVPHP